MKEVSKLCYNNVFNRYFLNTVPFLVKVVTGRETLEFLQVKLGQVQGKQATAVLFGPISISLPISLKAKFHEFIKKETKQQRRDLERGFKKHNKVSEDI